MPLHQQVTTCRKTNGPTSKRCTCEHCNLAVCSVCGGWEGSLTTDCPGEKIRPERLEEILETSLDFTDARGWHLAKATERREPRFRYEGLVGAPPPPRSRADLTDVLAKKAVAWARADQLSTEKSIALTHIEDDVDARLPKGQEASWITEENSKLLGQLEQATSDFQIAEHHAQKCDDEFKQAARKLAEIVGGDA